MTMLDERWPFTLWARIHAGLAFDHPAGLREILDETTAAQVLTASGTAAVEIVTESAVQLSLSLGHVAAASQALRSIPPDGWPALRARTALIGSSPADAERIVDSVLDDESHSSRTVIDLLMVRAAARHELANLPGAADDLMLVLKLAGPDVLRPFLTVPRHVLTDLVDHVTGLDRVVATITELRLHPIYPTRVDSVRLTERERSIAASLAAGLSAAEIARQDFVGLPTVKNQVRLLYRKLGVHTRQEMITKVRDRGLLE